MADVKFSLDARKALKLTNDVVMRMGKNSTIMDVIAIQAWKNVIQHFRDEEGKSRPWPKWSRRLSDGTRKFYTSRPTKRGGTKLLQDTGLLRTSIRPRSKEDEAHVFTKTKYAGYHQFGTRNIPKRDFLWIAQDKINKMARKFIEWVVQGRK